MRRTMTAAAVAAALVAGTGGAASATTPAYGQGWSAIVHHPTGWGDGRATLRMVGPTGSSVTIGDLSDDATIQDVSLDGRQVATARVADDGRTHFAFWNTSTHRASFIRLPGDWEAAYQAGGRILTWRRADGLSYVRDSTGNALSTYRITPNTQVMVSPDGSRLVEATDKAMTVRSAVDGRIQRTLPSPAAYGCYPVMQWDSASFSAMCQIADTVDGVRPYRFGYTSPVPTSALAPQGISVVVPTTPRVGVGSSGDGWDSFYTVTPTTRTPLTILRRGALTGGYGSTTFAVRPNATDSGEVLVKYDSSSGRLTTLAGAPGTGVVTQAVTNDGHG